MHHELHYIYCLKVLTLKDMYKPKGLVHHACPGGLLIVKH